MLISQLEIDKLKKLEQTQDYLGVLGVEPQKGNEEKDITSAYKKLAKKYHPDKNRDDTEHAEVMFKIIENAFQYLKKNNWNNPKVKAPNLEDLSEKKQNAENWMDQIRIILKRLEAMKVKLEYCDQLYPNELNDLNLILNRLGASYNKIYGAWQKNVNTLWNAFCDGIKGGQWSHFKQIMPGPAVGESVVPWGRQFDPCSWLDLWLFKMDIPVYAPITMNNNLDHSLADIESLLASSNAAYQKFNKIVNTREFEANVYSAIKQLEENTPLLFPEIRALNTPEAIEYARAAEESFQRTLNNPYHYHSSLESKFSSLYLTNNESKNFLKQIFRKPFYRLLEKILRLPADYKHEYKKELAPHKNQLLSELKNKSDLLRTVNEISDNREEKYQQLKADYMEVWQELIKTREAVNKYYKDTKKFSIFKKEGPDSKPSPHKLVNLLDRIIDDESLHPDNLFKKAQPHPPIAP